MKNSRSGYLQHAPKAALHIWKSFRLESAESFYHICKCVGAHIWLRLQAQGRMRLTGSPLLASGKGSLFSLEQGLPRLALLSCS